MSHLNIYLPQDLEKELKKNAKAKKLSLSGYFVELVRSQKPSKKWDKKFLSKALGGWMGDFPEVSRELPQETDSL